MYLVICTLYFLRFFIHNSSFLILHLILQERLHILNVGAEQNPPLLFTNPFCYEAHPWVKQAANEVTDYLRSVEEWQEEISRGKMFGVLVVRKQDVVDRQEDGAIYYLAAFSGFLNGENDMAFFVPPIYNVMTSKYFQEEQRRIEGVFGRKEERRKRSEALQDWLFEQYRCRNARGEEHTVMQIFKDYYETHTLKRQNIGINSKKHHIPSGTGECCAPKLLQYAFLHHLEPLCMGEWWMGMSPKCEVRHEAVFYPACHNKCLPILSFMLQGLEVEEKKMERETQLLVDACRVLLESEDYVIIDKPSGLLSVPGRTDDASVRDWFVARYDEGMYFPVHRLDQDTSGILIIAKNEKAYVSLQHQFITHTIRKTYTALLDGIVEENEGRISLPLRPDFDDRPRQMVDWEHGKRAVTDWRVMGRNEGVTRIEFYPQTGRTHQLRLHSAHREGLNAPIIGDRLYGKPSECKRLCLHASGIEFNDPLTDERIRVESKPPF